jgi:hypothetical protein
MGWNIGTLTASMEVAAVRTRGALFLRYLGAATALLISAWLLLGYEGLKTTAQDRSRGWNIYELPSHPTLNMVAYLAFGVALPFFSAWLMRPAGTYDDAGKTSTYTLWRSFSFRLVLSFGFALLTAFILAFLEMALLDAGVI